jgi:hypothetical protein
MNKIANNLFNQKEFVKQIADLAKRQYGRRKGAYSAISIFELEDLEQELWCALFESDGSNAEELLDIAEKKAEALAQQGIRKRGNPPMVEIPISQLEENERHYVENLLYSSAGNGED